jgi:hypothetical protein
MLPRPLFAALLYGTLGLASCSTEHGDSPLARKSISTKAPIATWVWGKYVDENSPLDYQVKFRNVGNEVLSFDYTIADSPSVPHLDRNGPNSGFVPNLYPGAEVAVPNPLKRRNVFVALGRVTYGKKSLADLQKAYPSDAAAAFAEADLTSPLGLGDLPAKN